MRLEGLGIIVLGCQSLSAISASSMYEDKWALYTAINVKGMGQCPVVVWQVQTVELFSFSELADSFPVCSLHSNDCTL